MPSNPNANSEAGHALVEISQTELLLDGLRRGREDHEAVRVHDAREGILELARKHGVYQTTEEQDA